MSSFGSFLFEKLEIQSKGIGLPIAERHKVVFCNILKISIDLLGIFRFVTQRIDELCKMICKCVRISIAEIGSFTNAIKLMNKF